MGIHSDPTANMAIGAINKEWRQMVRKAIALRRTSRELTLEEKRLFTGIYRRLLEESPAELEKLKEKGA